MQHVVACHGQSPCCHAPSQSLVRLPTMPPWSLPQVYLYNTYKLPIDAAVALATELKRQLAAAVAALTAEGGSKADEAAMPKAG